MTDKIITFIVVTIATLISFLALLKLVTTKKMFKAQQVNEVELVPIKQAVVRKKFDESALDY